MPNAPKKQCSSPGCHNISIPGKAKCSACSKEIEKERGTSSQRFYGYKWQKAREAFLIKNSTCVRCDESGPPYHPATVVDHKIPHDGDFDLFWDRSNWQGLCESCHNIKTANEDGGFGRTKLNKNYE